MSYQGCFSFIMRPVFFLILALALVLSACGVQTEAPSDTAESDVSDTEPGESTDQGLSSDTVDIAFDAYPVYREAVTEKSGSVLIEDLSVRVNYTSSFYGHDSAVDRDFVQYGWRFNPAKCSMKLEGCFLGQFLGDIYSDAVKFEDGILTITDINVENRRSNGTVFADDSSKFTPEDPVKVKLPVGGSIFGVGDFDGNGYTDICICEGENVYIAFFSEGKIALWNAGSVAEGSLGYLAGDADGDGLCDLLALYGGSIKVYYSREAGLCPGEEFTLPLTARAVYCADINNDRRCDLVLDVSDGCMKIKTLFGLGGGKWGPGEAEEGNTNLYAYYENDRFVPDSLSFGDLTGDGVCDIYCTYEGGEALLISADEPAYDYSVFAMVRDGKYVIYSGGRWFDQSDKVANAPSGTGDGDHVMIYHSDDGITYQRYIAGPAFYLGWEQGLKDWWTDNTLEPEVVYIDGVYHMLWQCTGVTKSGWYGDYLGYASSTDGIHFERKTDSPVIIPSAGKSYRDFDIEIGFNHEELIYVPDDPEGKCFWLYTGHYINNNWSGYVRIRSSDPTCFCWDEREGVSGTSQIGNQIGYISDFDGCGNRLFLRISFKDYEDEKGVRTCPFLQLSHDGINWEGSEVILACTDISDPIASRNKNAYFLGFATVDGTGEIEKTSDGRYKLMYYATTSNSPGGGEIWHAEIGSGEMYFTLEY